MISVAQLLDNNLPAGTKLLAGNAGLPRPVTWVASLRTRPPAFAGFKGGELALLSSKSLKLVDEDLTLEKAIAQLAQVQIAAVAVLGEINPRAVELAQSISLPLFLLPEETTLQEVERSVSRAIIEAQNEMYTRNLEINRQLTDIMVSTRGSEAIVNKLGQITGKPVVLEDRNFSLRAMAWATPSQPDKEEVSSLLATSSGDVMRWARTVPLSVSEPPTAEFSVLPPFSARLVAPVVGNEGIVGFLSIIANGEIFSEVDRLAATRGATACAIEMAKERAVAEAEDKVQAHFLDDILSGNLTNKEAAIDRAHRLGYDLDHPHFVLSLRLQSPNSQKNTLLPGDDIAADAREMITTIENEFSRENLRVPVRVKNNTIIILCPVVAPGDERITKKTTERIELSIRSRLSSQVSIGVGRLYPEMDNFKASFQEAEQAVAMGTRLFGKGKTTYFTDLGLHRLLFSMHGDSNLEDFHRELLGKLVAYDTKNNSEMVKTLDAYFLAGNSPTEAAERLHLHRNTLLYRLQRIEDILGIDLHDPEICLALHLALRIGETLEALKK